VKADQKRNVLITQADGEKNVIESKVKAEVVEIVNKAKASANKVMKATDQTCDVMAIEANSKLISTQSKYAALMEEGKAEAKNLEAFDAQRRYEFELNKAKAFQGLAK
jgi:regulator of protease activity HflC (stomatin/prohibitin superfamily)